MSHALSGLFAHVVPETQGVALGCRIAPFQGFERINPEFFECALEPLWRSGGLNRLETADERRWLRFRGASLQSPASSLHNFR